MGSVVAASLGYGVEAARLAGATAGDAADTEPGAAKRAESFDRLVGVGGTGGFVPARGAEQRRERELVEADQSEKYPSHFD